MKEVLFLGGAQSCYVIHTSGRRVIKTTPLKEQLSGFDFNF
jgi:hypothetical protein